MAAGHADFAALAFLLAAATASGRGGGVVGGASGAPGRGPRQTNGPGTRTQARIVQARTSGHSNSAGQRVGTLDAGTRGRGGQRTVTARRRTRPQHHQPPTRSQTPRPETKKMNSL